MSTQPHLSVAVGIPGRSNALTIARRLGLKPEVVDAAKTHLGGATDDVNQVIGLEAQRRRPKPRSELQVQRLYQKC